MNESERYGPRRLDRREAIATLAGATLALAIPGSARGATPQEVRTRPIPSSGEQVPVVGLGTSRTFDVGTSAGARAPLHTVLGDFVANGGTLVDTSPMYGASEAVIGDLGAELNVLDRLFVATKVWTSGEEAGVEQMETSARRLRRPVMDLMQVHNLVDWRTQLRTLRAWKEAGRIRYLGITHYRTDAFEALERIMKAESLDFVQLNYSIATREAEQRLLPLAADRGIAVLVNRPFERGSLFRRVRGAALPPWAADFDCASWGQFFLKYIIGHPAVACPIPATSKPKHLNDNMGAARGRLPDEAGRRRMVAWMESL